MALVSDMRDGTTATARPLPMPVSGEGARAWVLPSQVYALSTSTEQAVGASSSVAWHRLERLVLPWRGEGVLCVPVWEGLDAGDVGGGRLRASGTLDPNKRGMPRRKVGHGRFSCCENVLFARRADPLGVTNFFLKRSTCTAFD